MSKVCKICDKVKEYKEFVKNKNMKDGYMNKCKDCNNEYHRSYKKEAKTNIDKKIDTYLRHKLNNIKLQDKRKFPDEEFTLTLEDLKEIYKRQEGLCIYSGVKLQLHSKATIYKKLSFDRIENGKPHTKDNLQMTSQFMNMYRGSKSHEQFMEELNNCP